MCLIKTHLISILGFKMSAIKLTEEYADISKAQSNLEIILKLIKLLKREVSYTVIYMSI